MAEQKNKKPTAVELAAIEAVEMARKIIKVSGGARAVRRGNILIDEYEKKYLKK